MNLIDEVIDLSFDTSCDSLLTPEKQKEIQNCSQNTFTEVNLITEKTEQLPLSNSEYISLYTYSYFINQKRINLYQYFCFRCQHFKHILPYER